MGEVGRGGKGYTDFMDRFACVDLDFCMLDGEGGGNGE